MLLEPPEDWPEKLVIGGEGINHVYAPDSQGRFNVPDNQVHDGLFAAGFTVAVEPVAKNKQVDKPAFPEPTKSKVES